MMAEHTYPPQRTRRRRRFLIGFLGVLGVLCGGELSAQQQTPPPAGESPYRIAGRLPVRIMDFKVEPTTIDPGQSVTLSWWTENPTSITIDPIGRVAPRGQQKLTPSATTTYTLSVTGASNSSDKRTVTVVVKGTTARATPAGASVAKVVPRTADGHPDFSGVYGYGGAGRGGPPPATPVLKPGAEKFKVARPADDTGQYS